MGRMGAATVIAILVGIVGVIVIVAFPWEVTRFLAGVFLWGSAAFIKGLLGHKTDGVGADLCFAATGVHVASFFRIAQWGFSGANSIAVYGVAISPATSLGVWVSLGCIWLLAWVFCLLMVLVSRYNTASSKESVESKVEEVRKQILVGDIFNCLNGKFSAKSKRAVYFTLAIGLGIYFVSSVFLAFLENVT